MLRPLPFLLLPALLGLVLAACAPRAALDLPAPPAAPGQPRLPGLDEVASWGHGETRLHLELGGEGSPVLLLHELEPGADAYTSWRRNTVALKEAGYRVYAADLPGFGRAGRPARRLTPGDLLGPLESLLEALPAQAAVVVAAGRAAALAVDLAARRPELVRAMVLVAPTGYGPVPDEAAVAERYVRLEGGGGLFSTNVYLARASLDGVLSVLRNEAYADPANVPPEVVSSFLTNLAAPGSEATVYSVLSGSLDLSVEASWPRTGQPTLLVWGAGDRRVPVAAAERFSLARPETELRVIAGARTAVAEERGLAFNAFMIEFLLREAPPR